MQSYLLKRNEFAAMWRPILDAFINKAIPRTVMMRANSFSPPMGSSSTYHEVKIPDIGTITDNGATWLAGYFSIIRFHTQYPNTVAT